MRIKEKKEEKSSEPENKRKIIKIYFINQVSIKIETFLWIVFWIAIKKYSCNTGVGFFKNIWDDPFNFIQKVLPFISESWTVEKEVIQCFDIKTANTNRFA